MNDHKNQSTANNDWQPIETAPKGKVILFFPEVNNGGRNHLIEMIEIGYPNGFPYRKPSHWMPLPKPPSQERQP